jgi:hypothetical protein
MSAAGPAQGRPRARGEAQARKARAHMWMVADSDTSQARGSYER